MIDSFLFIGCLNLMIEHRKILREKRSLRIVVGD